MTNAEAYDGISYEKRAATTYTRGQRVYMGPGYVGNNHYEPDEFSGRHYYIVSRIGESADYKVATRPNDTCWVCIVHASRLVAA